MASSVNHTQTQSIREIPEQAPNMELIQNLYEIIERNPPAIEALQLLMNHYMEIGWDDAAKDIARGLIRVDFANSQAHEVLRTTSSRSTESPNESRSSQPTPRTKARNRRHDPIPVPKSSDERAALERELQQGYEVLLSRSKLLLRETRLVRELQQQGGVTVPEDNNLQDLKALSDGRISAVVTVRPPRSARAVARDMEANQGEALDLVVTDLADVVRWLHSTNQRSPMSNDSIRERIVKRVQAIIATLPEAPEELQQYPTVALMHIEHEELGRTYLNTETMYGDLVSEIPRSNFWASEDGFAWDMSELAMALTSNSGVMRNPLSREMFTPSDIEAIVGHSLGQHLAALQLNQSELSRGVRSTTIDKLEELSAVLLADMSEDQVSSRREIDGFLAYVAILPRAEQRTIDELRVPANDSHTGQSFDCTIGEAVKDARANKVCLHKTGDLIGQAAQYLRQSNNF